MVATKYQDYMFGLLKKVIDEIGPRPPCSEAEKKLGRLLVEEWKPVCDKVDVESFTCSPHASIGSIPVLVLLFLAAVVLYWFLPPLALALAAASCGILVFEVFRVREFVDFLFPRRQGENVVGTFRPRGEIARRFIVSAHMDSAYEFTPYLYLKSAANLVIAVGVLAVVIGLFGSLAKTLAYFNVFSGDAALNGVGIAMIALSPVAGVFLFWTLWKPVPGGFDDMSAVSVVAGLGRYLGEAKKVGEWFPDRTEVVLLATSSEEAGLRGAKRYVKRHLREMKAIQTHFVTLELVKDEKYLAVYTGSPSTGARHDPELVKIAHEVAGGHNWPLDIRPGEFPYYDDSTAFSLNGISATCLEAGSITDPAYHTRNDTYEHVRPESLSVMLQLVIDMIKRIDVLGRPSAPVAV